MRPIYTCVLMSVLALTSYSASAADKQQAPANKPSTADTLLAALRGTQPLDRAILDRLGNNWQVADTPIFLESMRFLRHYGESGELNKLLQKKSGKNYAYGSDEWQQWLWSQEYKEHPDYAAFKGKLYQSIDPKFAAYFANEPKSTIRLDEIRWGGVVQDGIPPLRKPRMISPSAAKYLGDSDVVFGIEVDGDFRAYPKRILAWHEMFTDTIQGVPLAGVY